MAKSNMYKKYEWPESQLILELDDVMMNELGIEPADNMTCFVPIESISEISKLINQFDTNVC